MRCRGSQTVKHGRLCPGCEDCTGIKAELGKLRNGFDALARSVQSNGSGGPGVRIASVGFTPGRALDVLVRRTSADSWRVSGVHRSDLLGGYDRGRSAVLRSRHPADGCTLAEVEWWDNHVAHHGEEPGAPINRGQWRVRMGGAGPGRWGHWFPVPGMGIAPHQLVDGDGLTRGIRAAEERLAALGTIVVSEGMRG